MVKKITKITFFSIFVFSASATTLQNNTLCIKNANATFVMRHQEAKSISSDQPWEGVHLVAASDGRVCINVLAGRHATTAPVTWTKDNLKTIDNVPWYSQYMLPLVYDAQEGAMPSTFNFAFSGTLGFKFLDSSTKYACYNVFIGQSGKSSIWGGYIWWMFSNTTNGYWTLSCIDLHENRPVTFAYTNKTDGELELIKQGSI